jgi:hypothetical protein
MTAYAGLRPLLGKVQSSRFKVRSAPLFMLLDRANDSCATVSDATSLSFNLLIIPAFLTENGIIPLPPVSPAKQTFAEVP